MTKRIYARFLLAAIMLLMVVFLISTGPTPQAASAKCVSLPIYTYYTDATKTVACGFHDVCAAAQDGCVTPYKTSQRKLCCNPL
jgi:hypothetical protein